MFSNSGELVSIFSRVSPDDLSIVAEHSQKEKCARIFDKKGKLWLPNNGQELSKD